MPRTSKSWSVVAANKAVMPELSVTARSAGTDMSGGAINESIIVDFTKYFTDISHVDHTRARTQPGVMYEAFEKETLKYNALMPTYPASRSLCAIGGIVNNNSGGEKSLEYGKTADFVTELKVRLRRRRRAGRQAAEEAGAGQEDGPD
jgi:FAD/FMN-containing dehydrogenase